MLSLLGWGTGWLFIRTRNHQSIVVAMHFLLVRHMCSILRSVRDTQFRVSDHKGPRDVEEGTLLRSFWWRKALQLYL